MFCPTQFSLGDLRVSCHIISFVQLLPQSSGIPGDGSVHVTLVAIKQAELSAPSTDICYMLLSGRTKCSLWGFLPRTRKIPVLIGSEYYPCERRVSLSLTRCCVWIAGMWVSLFSSTIDLLISLTGVFLLFLYLWRRYDHRTFTIVKYPEDKMCIHTALSSLKTNQNKKRHWNKNILQRNENNWCSMCLWGLLLCFFQLQLEDLLVGYFTSSLCCYFLASHFSIYFGPGFGISPHRKIPYSIYGKISFKKGLFSIGPMDPFLSKCKSGHLFAWKLWS